MAENLLEEASIIIQNVSDGAWLHQSPEWQAAATGWMEKYRQSQTVQGKMDERSRLGKELEDSEADIRAARRP